MSYQEQTPSGIPVKATYGPEDRPAREPAPGQFPFTRGNFATGYRGRLWTFRQYSGFGTAEESNERYRYLLGQGGTGLSRRARPADPVRLRLRRPGGRRKRSAGSAWPSTPWLMPRSCSTRSRSTRSARASRSTAPPRSCSPSTSRPRKSSGIPRRAAAPGRSRTTSSRSTCRGAPGSGRPRLAPAHRRHHRVLRARSAAVQRHLGGGRPLP